MKKIIFNDRYGLTQAVLEGRKTQTRRILNPTMFFKRMKTYEGWSKEDISAWKRSCNRRICEAQGAELQQMLDYALSSSRYNVYDVVAVAQSYQDVLGITHVEDLQLRDALIRSKGYTNKMFVRADLMPNRIRITNIRIERLQDISEEDCLAEGIVDFESRINKAHFYSITDESATYGTAKKPYSLLIDKIAGKGTWKRNPYVFVYEFELINHPLWD